ncbi:patatin-like phospholipase family protein [Leptospira sp. GIMC2001]|uniref:patatin-like phospholipase family protein n=1 Tax=Leptospira sp. GIMC2001 TaxID=1513297 RepID=UPI00234B9C39|nr:patatin-like phospholipase family protein [Leptospira sp. GIMC2001]WCL49214.1 patatin-like phospholipase family protein [Leptospira sp. GIMC2001]
MFPLERIVHNFIEIFSPPEVALAIAGGGCKALYGLGVGYEMKQWGLALKEVSGVSAGSAMALCLIGGSEEETVEYFEEITRRNDSNFKLSNLFFGERVFPHESMYRRTIRFAANWDAIKNSSSKVFILTVRAKPKVEEKFKARVELGKLIAETAQAYTKDERDRLAGIVCNRTQEVLKKWNMTEIVYTEKDFHSPEVLEQIIMNSSSIPPVVSMQSKENEYYIDGGLTNNLALEFFSDHLPKIGIYYEDSTLIGKNPDILNNTYLIKPSEPLPITSFDYTNPKGVRAAYELGKKDARNQKEKIMEHIRFKRGQSFPRLW